MEKISKKKNSATQSDVNFIYIIVDRNCRRKKRKKSHRTQSIERHLDSGSSVLLTLSFNAFFCIGLKKTQITRISTKKGKNRKVLEHTRLGTSRFANRRLLTSRNC